LFGWDDDVDFNSTYGVCKKKFRFVLVAIYLPILNASLLNNKEEGEKNIYILFYVLVECKLVGVKLFFRSLPSYSFVLFQQTPPTAFIHVMYTSIYPLCFFSTEYFVLMQ
jgi:hypothetical protein